jgi:hypothetical protein
MFFLSAQGAQKKHRFKIFIPGGAAAKAMQNSCKFLLPSAARRKNPNKALFLCFIHMGCPLAAFPATAEIRPIEPVRVIPEREPAFHLAGDGALC